MPSACPACGSSEHPSGARFCFACGTPLAPPSCAHCGAELVPGARFCSGCGAAQEATPPPAATAAAPVAERKVTSVLFCDLVGFTALSERHDQEEVRELLSTYFERARTIITRYGGTVEKFIGDAVMAVWGVPTAHEDDAERAVRAGLELVRAVEGLGDVVVPDLSLRVGIVTGEVAVTLGAEGQGMVAGDAVNTASRVQSVADPGQVWVDETTRLLTAAAITYADAGSHLLKGKAEPVPLWSARAVVAVVGGGQRADGLEAPLVGRDRELRLVKELFHATQESGYPSLVVVAGEPGVGKSRLGWELEKYVDGLTSPTRWHSGRCLAYGEGVAYWALAEAVRGRLGLVEADTESRVDEAVDAGLDEHVADEEEAAWLRPRLLALLGRGAGTFAREDLFAAWRTFLERVCADAPALVLTIDDAQDADEGTVLFLEHLLATAAAPMFLMVMARPGLLERWPLLATNRRATVLHLQPLPAREMAVMLDALVSGLPPALRDALVERAEGMPLFAVETVRSLIDRDLVVPRGGVYVPVDRHIDLAEVGAPASLQALVAARLDSLTPEQRRVVGDASVLGTSFTRDAIGALAADVVDLDAVLASLARLEILATEGSRLSAEYGSWHFVQAVVRQVAYGTLSRRDRKARHLVVVGHLEATGDPAGDLALVLARHYLDAIDASADGDADIDELRDRAVGCLRAAAARSRALGSPREALRHLEAALHRAVDPDLAAALREEAATAAHEAGLGEQAAALARASLEHWEEVGDPIAAGAAAAVLARTLTDEGESGAAYDLATEHWRRLEGVDGSELALIALGRAVIASALTLGRSADEVGMACMRISEALGDPQEMAGAFVGLAVVGASRTPTFSRVLLTAAAEIGREQQDPASVARCLANITASDLGLNVSRCLALNEEAREAARKSGVAHVLAHTLSNSGLALYLAGRWDEALGLLEGVASDVGNACRAVVGDLIRSARLLPLEGAEETSPGGDDESELAWRAVHRQLRDDERPGGTLADGLPGVVGRLYEAFGAGDDFVVIWPTACELALRAGSAEAVRSLLALLDRVPQGLVGVGLRAHRQRVGALLDELEGLDAGHDRVEAALRAAVDGFDKWGSPVYRARAEADLARWLAGAGRADEAAALRSRAADAFRVWGAQRWLQQLEEQPVRG